MRDGLRFRLLGTYKTPRVRVGAMLPCAYRGEDVIVVRFSTGRIPWPVGKRAGVAGSGLVLYGDLAKAVQRESNQAVAHWFGVCASTVRLWRSALGVTQYNEGTHKLRVDYTEEDWYKRAVRKGANTPWTPARLASVRRKLKGKKRPSHVVEAMRRAKTGVQYSAEVRARMSAAQRARRAAERKGREE